MSDRSKIEWTDASWNPLRAKNPDTGKLGHHCVKISPACAHCYAASMNKRLGTGLDYSSNSRAETFLDAKVLDKPLHWKRPRRIFVCSMTDLFGEWVESGDIANVFATMYECQWHTFQVLTKRAERLNLLANPRMTYAIACFVWERLKQRDPHKATYLTLGDIERDILAMWPLPNVQIGVTVENQQYADERIPWLLKCPAAVRFVSFEPLLGLIDATKWLYSDYDRAAMDEQLLTPLGGFTHSKIGWAIVGGESGPQARPMQPDWARSLRDQCEDPGVPFFFKQWGEWLPAGQDGARIGDDQILNCSDDAERVGKKKAGRLLDGREWNEFPTAAEAAVTS